MMPQSPSKSVPWDLTQFSQSPSAAPLYFPESHWRSKISSLLKVILVWGKARSLRVPIWAVGGAESPGWFDVSQKKLCRRHDAWAGTLSWWSCHHQLPTAAAFWIIWIVSVEECSSLMQNLIQIPCPTHSVILNVTATKYTCSPNNIYFPHWLVQWSSPCSCMCIPVHSPWLPGYIDVAQTILIMLTMAGLFPDTPHKNVQNNPK